MDNPHYTTYLKSVGRRVREARKTHGLSMEQLALKAEIEYRQLGRIERGEGNTTVVSLLRIAAVLNISLKEFFE